MKEYSVFEGRIFCPNEKFFSILKQVVREFLNFPSTVRRIGYQGQVHLSLLVYKRDIETIEHKLQLLGWKRV
jgi:hypothetical protein